MVQERLRLLAPLHEEDTDGTVTGELMRVHWIELDPVGCSDVLQTKLHRNLRSILVHVSPVPKRACLGNVSTKRRDVVVISRQIHHLNATGVRFEISAHWSRRDRIPNHKHRVFSGIGCNDPLLVLTAENAGDFIAVALEQFLLFCYVVVDYTCVCSRIKNLCALIIGQKVHTLINVHVEAKNFV